MRSRFFSDTELACKCCHQAPMDPGTLQKADRLRELFGKPLVASSAYRCPAHNQAVSSTGATGPHTTGHAIDFAVSGADALVLIGLAIAAGFTGIGVNQKGAGRFIHVDDLPNKPGQPRPHIWSY